VGLAPGCRWRMAVERMAAPTRRATVS
jgi:hypothetical protein